MTDELKRLRKALTKIAEVASAAVGDDEDDDVCKGKYEPDDRSEFDAEQTTQHAIVCTPKYLPAEMQIEAAREAAAVNPFNQPEFQLSPGSPDAEISPLAIAVSTSRYWGSTPRTLSVSFMETTAQALKKRIIDHLNAWSKTGCIRFAETRGIGQVRISRGRGGFYSYLGTDIRLISPNVQTMNLQGFTMNTPEAEFLRVVRHEAGHTLGFPHEHMRRALVARIDPEKAYAFFGGPPNFWSRSMVNQQVLTPLDERTLMGTPADQTSIMCYQLPGSITRDGRPILGGRDINQSDFAFVGQIYPKPFASPGSPEFSPELAPAAEDPLEALGVEEHV